MALAPTFDLGTCAASMDTIEVDLLLDPSNFAAALKINAPNDNEAPSNPFVSSNSGKSHVTEETSL